MRFLNEINPRLQRFLSGSARAVGTSGKGKTNKRFERDRLRKVPHQTALVSDLHVPSRGPATAETKGGGIRAILNRPLDRINNASRKDSPTGPCKIGWNLLFLSSRRILATATWRTSTAKGTARSSHILQPQDQGHPVKTLCPELKQRLPLGLIRISSRIRSAKWTERYVLHIPMEANNACKVNLEYFPTMSVKKNPIGNITLYARVVRLD